MRRLRWVLVLVSLCSIGVRPAHGEQITLINSFNTGLGQLNDAAFDRVSGNLFLSVVSGNIIQYDPVGRTVINAIGRTPAGLDFTPEPVNIGGTVVPANTLLQNNSFNEWFALNKNSGAVLASLLTGPPLSPNIQFVAGAYHPSRDTFFAVDGFFGTVVELKPSDGAELAGFLDPTIGIDVLEATGNLFLLGDTLLREITPDGAFVKEIDVGSLGISEMRGIAFDDLRGDAWISTLDGTVYQLGGFQAIPEPCTLTLAGIAGTLGMLGYGWRRRKKSA